MVEGILGESCPVKNSKELVQDLALTFPLTTLPLEVDPKESLVAQQAWNSKEVRDFAGTEVEHGQVEETECGRWLARVVLVEEL